MYNYKFICIILLITLQYSKNIYAQEKFEKESRVRQKDIPPTALKFIDSLDLKNKIKWYKEERLTGKSFEAKFKHNNLRHSVEFDTLGNVEDMEIEVKWEDLEYHLRDSISFHLNKSCLKHKIVKVQIQYSGAETEMFSKIKTNENDQYLTINYELIVRCNRQKKVELFEYLFSDAGKPLYISKIVFKNSSHLEY